MCGTGSAWTHLVAYRCRRPADFVFCERRKNERLLLEKARDIVRGVFEHRQTVVVNRQLAVLCFVVQNELTLFVETIVYEPDDVLSVNAQRLP